MAVGVAIIIATGNVVYYKMMLVQDIMNNSLATDFSAQSRITEHMFQIGQASLVGFVAFAIASFTFALLVSHRVAGPALAITKFINELKEGNFEYGRRLRPNDELTVIMDNLHELNEVLKDKYSDNSTE
jgi:signal transduction histidine kinase